MEERGTHRININILPGLVRINSEFIYTTHPRPNGVATDEFASVTEAKRKLSSLYSLYERFNTAYNLLLVAQAGEFVANIGRGIGDFGNHTDALGGDFLRLAGIIGIGIITILADEVTSENRVKTANKKLAVEGAEQSGRWHYRDIYPF